MMTINKTKKRQKYLKNFMKYRKLYYKIYLVNISSVYCLVSNVIIF